MMVQVSSKEEIREHVSCSMCKNIFSSPQELACFHVFCERCVKTLPREESENKQGFHCPTCKTFCILGEEKTPYMRNEFVKIFTSGEEKCGPCGKGSAVWKCQECDYILCDDCKMHHSKMMMSKSHIVLSREKTQGLQFIINKQIVCEVHADDIVKHYCTICQELICSNCLAEKHIHKLNDVSKLSDAAESFIPVIRKKIDSLEGKNKTHEDQVSSSESQMNEVREGFDGVRIELDQTRQTVIQKINAQYDRDVKILEECKNMEIQKLIEFKEKKEYEMAETNCLVSFTKVILSTSKSGNLLKELTQGLHKRLDDSISKNTLNNSEKINLPSLEQNTSVLTDEHILGKIQWDHVTKNIIIQNRKPERIKSNSCLVITSILSVITAFCVFYMLQTVPGAQINNDFRHVKQNISEVMDKLAPAGTDIYTLPSSGYRMALVNDTIWIPLFNNDSIAVITLNGTEVTRIYFPGYTDLHPWTVLQVNESEILLASDKGLFVLDSTGQIQYRVTEGEYHDISKYDERIIALQWISDEGITLHSLKSDTMKWIADRKHISINTNSHFYVTMTVYNEFVYITSWSFNHVYKYTLGGVLLHTYGGPGLSYPSLSAVDPWGTVLVCDKSNHQLVALSAEGEWREYRLEGGWKEPDDVIIVNQSLYMLWWDSKDKEDKISQYTIGH